MSIEDTLPSINEGRLFEYDRQEKTAVKQRQEETFHIHRISEDAERLIAAISGSKGCYDVTFGERDCLRIDQGGVAAWRGDLQIIGSGIERDVSADVTEIYVTGDQCAVL